ncbi:SE-domain-containing protein [Daldinia bambusicola]|nr:SE-domain-containing protein [Daldinia bambusicola]
MSETTVVVETLPERRAKHHEAEVVVVGAGVFGCAIAYALAEQGRSVILLERWLKEPNRIVGELMQPGGVNSLRKLGLGHTIEGIDGQPCHGFSVFFYGKNVQMPYPRVQGLLGPEDGDKNTKEKAGKVKDDEPPRPQGKSFHHGRFITQLRKACLQHPNISVFETEAVSTVKGDHNPEILGVETRTTDPETGEKRPDYFFGQLTIVADGYASRFRKQYIRETPQVRSKFYALELLDCELPSPGYGHVVIGAPSPVLIYQIGARETRILVDVPEKLPQASVANGGVRGYMAKVVLPALPGCVQPSFGAALERDGKIPQSMPNSWLPPTKQSATPGLAILGDAMNMRHPLTGGGMTVALNDAVLLRDLLAPIADLSDTAAVSQAMDTLHWRRKRLTSIINVLAMALYSLFAAAGDEQLAKLQRGCFAYFERGVVRDPMGLLGGLIPDPLVLAYHFFSVAFLAIWLDWKATGLWKVPVLLWNAFWVLWTASRVFLPVMYREAFV